jgi:hypothetical protein
VLKYHESDGSKDLGNPNQRPMVHGRHQEIVHRVKNMREDLNIE